MELSGGKLSLVSVARSLYRDRAGRGALWWDRDGARSARGDECG